jgi:hypothetical protein
MLGLGGSVTREPQSTNTLQYAPGALQQRQRDGKDVRPAMPDRKHRTGI